MALCKSTRKTVPTADARISSQSGRNGQNSDQAVSPEADQEPDGDSEAQRLRAHSPKPSIGLEPMTPSLPWRHLQGFSHCFRASEVR